MFQQKFMNIRRKRTERIKGFDKLKDLIPLEQNVSNEKISKLFAEIGRKANSLFECIEESKKTLLQDDTFLFMAISSGMGLLFLQKL